MNELKTKEDFLNLKKGDVIYHINPYMFSDNKKVTLEVYVLEKDVKNDRIYYGSDEYDFISVTDCLAVKKSTFTNMVDASDFLTEYHNGKQYEGVLIRHTKYLRRL